MYERGKYDDGKQLASHAREIGESLDETESPESLLELQDLRSNIYYTLGAIAQITHDYGESLDLHAKLVVYRKKLKFKSGKADALLAHAYNEFGNDFMTADEATDGRRETFSSKALGRGFGRRIGAFIVSARADSRG